MQDEYQSLAEKTDAAPLIQLIVFHAGNEEFAVPISSVREIIKIGTITPIPNVFDFIKGIINVRGEIVTIIDIGTRFSLSKNKNVQPKHVVVTKQEDTLFGLLVDEVVEVLRIRQEDIQPSPSLITKMYEKYIESIVTLNDRLIMVLDISKILSIKEFTQIYKQTHRELLKNNKLNKPIQDQ